MSSPAATPAPLLARLAVPCAVAGSVLVCAAVLVSALLYSGRAGEPYSILNHFISELGETGVSRGARVFNAALVVGGALFVPASVGMGLRIGGVLAGVGIAAGAAAGVFLAGVGFFPMNNLSPHMFTALWFFRCGLGFTLSFGLAIVLRPRRMRAVPRGAAVFSAVAVGVYGTFLAMMTAAGPGGLHSAPELFGAARPAVWPLAVAEWAVFFATVLWFLGVGLILARAGSAGKASGPSEAPTR